MSFYDGLLQVYLKSPAAQAGLAAAEQAGQERRQAVLALLTKICLDSKSVEPEKLGAWLEAEDGPLAKVLVSAGHGSLLRAFGAKASVAACRWVADKLEGKVEVKV